MADTRTQVLRLYRDLLKAGNTFSSYNFREYAIRRTRDAFRANASVTEAEKVQSLIQRGKKELTVIKRQGFINSQFQTEKLVVEH
ncbi:hypothetical protein K7432_011733 [Basidiobolus ranarum]|uniref:Complex 1 LYR protein domain-containing protein n=1 Tax=Basidiobolus ranarum TaxID=34480 RepID=A0ABR2WLR1_9FUNG